jgi:DNA-directed RNA polymerase II subunit RPB1
MPAGFHQATSDVESVVGIQFGIFSPEEIVKRSVVEIISQGTYDGNEPKIGGLFDPRMGVLENGKTCRSCGQTNHNCPGHFGHYRLARPVYFIQFLPLVLNVLRCVCIRCSKLLIDKESHKRLAKRRGEARWREVLALCSNIKRCGQETEDGCGTLKPDRFVRDGIARIIAEWDPIPDAEGKSGDKTKQPLEVEYVQRLFRQVLDEDVDFMGLSRHWCRPDWMICPVLPIPPPQVRPSVIQDNNQRSEDDLTHKLFEIIKVNKQLQDKIDKNANRQIIDEYTNILQYHVATLVDNKIPGVAPSAQRGGRPLKSIQQRIGSKEGRVRYNIQGKRVEQSARTVITGDPNISIAEVGVPMKIAMNLTKPERVTNFNRDILYKYVQNGADTFPGAKSIIRSDGRMISLKHVNTKELVLYNGDIVNRHLIDGDYILFNRQPTLHRMSMMGHRVRVLPFNTFRLNVQVVRPYNADFDGDEMNAHIPQSYEASVELADIAAVPHQIIRPRDGIPVITVVQDTLVGAYIATKPNNFFTRREFMNLMMWNKRFEELPQPRSTAGKDNAARYTGQQIIGALMPPISLDMPNKMFKKNEAGSELNMVKIREGDVQQGIFDKDIFNKPGRGIIHVTYNDYGPEQTVNLIDGLQQVLESYLIMKGFSVGISDMIADEKTREEMNEVIQKCKAQVEETILQVHMDLFTNNTGKTNQDEFESRIFATLNKALEAGKIGEGSLAIENRLTAMIRAGSKGDSVNISQMIACLGQQAPEGRRIPYGFTDRTLPHYKKYDDGAEARGFVESSFIRGLTPQEFFFHAMSGREGLIDTAVKTSETGYTQRQLIKAMEDLMINHDGTVRDANGGIVQFYYGEDGVNSTKIENITIGTDKMTEQDIKTNFGLVGVDWSQVVNVQNDIDQDLLDTFVTSVQNDRKMLVEGVYMSGRSLSLFAPMNIERILLNIKIKFGIDSSKSTNLTVNHVLTGIDKIIKRTQTHNKIWAASLRFHLAPHKIILADRFTKEAFDTMIETIVVKNWKAWSQPGELVGIIAAQSIGEPSTQMTLNTFHQAGVAAKSNMTRGVPRLKELLKVTHNPKATSLTIYLKPEFRESKDRIREVVQDLELTLLRDIVLKAAIYYDPKDSATILKEDKELLKFYEAFESREEADGLGEEGYSKWLLRLEFDREKMFNRSIMMDDVYFVLKDKFSDVNMIYSDQNSQKLVMRFRIAAGDTVLGDDLEGLKKFQNKILTSVVIRGIPGIRAATFRKDSNRVELNNGEYKAIDQYIIDTDGSNFLEVRNHPAVDGDKIYSTNIHDIYSNLGIEATRGILYAEISGLFEEAGINYRHLGLLVDTMTRNGRLMSIDRYGINKNDIGPLAKACFEETEKILLKAAQFGEMDPVTGVSANIMMGQPIRSGTAFTQILLDEIALPKLLEGLAPLEEDEQEVDEMNEDLIDEELYEDPNDKCSSTQLQMNVQLPKQVPIMNEPELEVTII